MHNAAATRELIKLARRRGFAEKKEAEKLEGLLRSGADPNAFTSKEESVLMKFMAGLHDPRCVEILLAHGADPNLSRRLSKFSYRLGEGETPLAIAINTIFGGHALEWTRQLLKAGAAVNQLDSRGKTALDHAVSGMVSLSDEVLGHIGRPLGETTTFGVIQIFYTRVRPRLECSEEMLKHGAETTLLKVSMQEFIGHVKQTWNICVDWENTRRPPAHVPEPNTDGVIPYEELL